MRLPGSSDMKCKICNTRKPRRYCPGMVADICSICCGAEREVTVNCPLDCPYLVEARQHERLVAVDSEQIPNQDVRVTEEFLREHEPLLIFLGAKLLESSLGAAGAIDADVRDALDSMIRTYRTLQSGLYYETLSPNLVAAAIQQNLQQAVDTLRKELSEKGATTIRDVEILAVLVFLQRIALSRDNGRPKGRAFIDYLRAHFPHDRETAAAPSLIQV
jgi:hypothetical protein